MNVKLFVPCLVDQFFPRVAQSAARVLITAGVEVDCPSGQTCCGQPWFKTGHWRQARKLALHFMDLFEDAEAIVAPSGSCISMVKHYYPLLFRDDAPKWDRAMAVSSKAYEFTQFLVDRLHIEDLGASFHARAVFHDSCQVARALGVKEQPRKLLSKVKGLELLEIAHPERCCGFGGSFSLQFPMISEALVEEKAQDILKTGATHVISCEISCLMNIGGFLYKRGHPTQSVHIAEVLDNREG